MPMKPKRPCRYQGCPNLCEDGEQYCPKHKALMEKHYEKFTRGADGGYFVFELPVAKELDLKAAASATNEIPILGTSVTDYATALDIDDWSGVTGTNISGTSDLAPLDDQAAMLKELFPDAKNVGILYCSAEANSVYQAKEITSYLEGFGYTCKEFTFSDSNDVRAVTVNAANESDVIYIPTDNTAASNAEVINNVCLPAEIPIIAGEAGICGACGVATLSIDYYELGYTTGQMAYEVLVKGADISTLEVQYAPNVTKQYNAEICETLGITVPDGYTALESK